ncbi:hypothetical protein B5X24_HaOG204547 [Helicoverpa armigera]|uniref:Uncharacterized protein n=1 Tax=Helicoverpa armigera TaxID=29058 RepID=A0A2W1BUX8_HELAM|nr:hypothetical protein B5X24_HaOG204547 [Helicoverpa armigera]
MVLNGSLVLRFFLLICTITGLSAAPYNSQSLGILSEFISKDSNSPLIVVVDANNFKALDLDSQSQSKSDHSNHNHPWHGDHGHDNDREMAKDAIDAVYDILRSNQALLENQINRGSDRQIGVAEQCSNSQENSCSKDGDGEGGKC